MVRWPGNHHCQRGSNYLPVAVGRPGPGEISPWRMTSQPFSSRFLNGTGPLGIGYRLAMANHASTRTRPWTQYRLLKDFGKTVEIQSCMLLTIFPNVIASVQTDRIMTSGSF